MKTQNNNPYCAKFSRILATTILALTVAGFTRPALAAGNANPGVVPPHASPHGNLYSQWAVAWWQWALAVPADRNPLADTTGEFARENQSGPVWFLVGTSGNSVERSFTIPPGKTIFMPIYNWIFGAGVFDCDPTVPGVPCDIPSLRAAAAANTEAAEVLEVSIDGTPLENLEAYRAASEVPFPITLPDGNLLGVPPGQYFPQVTDGYWLMIAPLSKGTHEVRVYVRAPDTSYGLLEFTVTYHITVE